MAPTLSTSASAASVAQVAPKVAPTAAHHGNHLRQVQSFHRDIDRYMYLRNLQRDKSATFDRLLVSHTETILPYIYTPTVGEACQRYDELKVPTYGLYIRHTDRGRILDILKSHAQQDVSVVVVTDGERILGLGDLGVGGMGISEGKGLLYTAAAGVPPSSILPVCLDVGTERESLRENGHYSGLKQRRVRGDEYEAFVEEFIAALIAWRPHVLLQFEDFGNHTAFELLERYRSRLCCFNDDIQGTACVALAGILSALRASGQSLAEQRIVFLGAGEAGTGIGELVAQAAHAWHGVPIDDARRLCNFVDSQGLVTRERLEAGERGDARRLAAHKVPFAHPRPEGVSEDATLLDVVRAIKPTALIGVSVQAGAFDADVLAEMASNNERPIVFPLSNPTSKSECTFDEAREHTDGRVLFASGSPFPPVTDAETGATVRPAQANNAYVFPAIGHAAVLTKCQSIPDDVFLVAAKALADLAPQEDLRLGALFPPFSAIRDVSARLIAEVAHHVVLTGLGVVPADFDDVVASCGVSLDADPIDQWDAYARTRFYQPADEPTPKL